MKPICVPCQRFYRPKKNGFAFIEAMPKTNDRPPPGTAAPDQWEPYKLWMGDLWECQGCGHQLVSGVGFNRIAEHYEPDFAEAVKAYAPTLTVNDC